jgi:hypothetical protein
MVFFHVFHEALEGERWEWAVFGVNIGEQGDCDNVVVGEGKEKCGKCKKSLAKVSGWV